jgi:type IV secretory pathway VirB3-like protein
VYLIPKNIRTRFEFFQGFGAFELFLTISFIAVGLIVSFLVFFLSKHMLSFLIVIFFGALGLLVVKKDPRFGLSILELIFEYKHFYSKQRTYFYRYGSGRE